MGEIRKPIKKSSIEKKNKILEKGFTLMCEKGYHNVNSVDIAKYAGVSTGIIYQYFTDKRDIFIEGVKNYSSNIMFPMIDILDNTKIDKNNLEKILNSMIDSFIDTHKMSKKAHEELIAMSHIDDEINQIFKDNELKNGLESMLSMMKSMIMLIIVFAIGLGAIIIYNMGILSYSEKQYQFATLKVLGFSDKKIKKIFVQQNNWITVLSIIIGLTTCYYLT